MENIEVILEMMVDFLENKIKSDDFVMDLSAELFACEDEELNQRLANLKKACQFYEPDLSHQKDLPDFLNDEQLRKITQEEYEKLKHL